MGVVFRLALLAFAVALLPGNSFAAGGRLIVLGATPGRTPITPSGGSATLTIPVRNASNVCGSPVVTFYPKGAVVKGVRAELLSPETGPRVTCLIRPNEIMPLTVRMTLPANADADLLTGVVVVSLRADPAVAPGELRIVGMAPVPAPTESVQPSAATITAERWSPHGIKTDAATVTSPEIWVPSDAVPAGTASATPRTALLSSDNAHTVRVELERDDADKATPPDGFVAEKLKVDNLGPAGTYSGDLALAPGGTDKVTVTVEIGDVIWYPIIAVAIGALLGGLGVGLFQNWQRRHLLQARILRIRKQYTAARKKNPSGDPQYLLDDELSDSAIATLISQIKSAKDDTDFDPLTTETLDLADRVDRWCQIDHAERELINLSDALPQSLHAVKSENELVLKRAGIEPKDDAATTELVGELTRQARIVRELLRVWTLFTHHEPKPPPNLDPLLAYNQHRHAYRDEVHTNALMEELKRIGHELKQAPREHYESLLREIAPEGVTATWMHFDLLRIVDTTLPAQEPRPDISKEDPKRIERRVRMWGWVLATVSAAVTILAFTFTIYSDHFGTWPDYFKAFTAGFLGQLGGAAIAWNTFPPLRSYVIRRPAT